MPPDATALLREGCRSCCARSTRSCRTSRWALWDELGFAASSATLLDAPWPQVDAAALAQDEIELVLQVNGKLRGTLRVPAAADKGRSSAPRWPTPTCQKFVAGKRSSGSIVVPGKLVNVVV